MKKNKKSGIILITTLLFMAIAFMLAVIIAKNGKETLMGGNRYADSEQAYLAAVSGLEFIKGQLYRDKAWGTYKNNQLQIQPSTTSSDSNSQTIIIKKHSDNNGLTGYILLDTSKGQVSENNYDSKFEIFFKNNPTNKEYACINNIDNESNIMRDTANTQTTQLPTEASLPPSEENSNSPEQTAQTTTEDTTKNKRDVPAKSFYAYVKGTCGKTVRYAEAIFVSNGPKSLDGGSVINGKVNINSYTAISEDNVTVSDVEQYSSENPFITINNKSAEKNGKITSGNALTIESNSTSDPYYLLNSKNKTIISSKGIEIGNFNYSSQNLPDSKDTPSHITYDPNPKIIDKIGSLSDVDTVAGDTTGNTSTEQSEDNKYTELEPGTYVFINDIEKPQESHWVYTKDILTSDTENKEISTTKFEKLDINNKKFENIAFVTKENEGQKQQTRKINIIGKVESKGNLSFIVVDKQNPKDKDNPENTTSDYKYTQSSRNTVDFSISDKGVIKTKANSGNANLFINGEVTGSGKIYCDGNLTMNSGSTLETQANSGVAVWAKGNVDIKEAKNLTSESESLQNMIIKDGIEEAKNSGLPSEGTDININGQNTQISTSEQTQTNDTIQTVTFKHEKTEPVPPHERNKRQPKTVTTNYKIEIKGDAISIYENEKKEPIFRSTATQLKSMYNFKLDKQDFNLFDIWIDCDNQDSAYINYWLNYYKCKGKIESGKVKLEDYDSSDSWGYYRDNHIGDMQLYIDGKSVGIIDINYQKYNSKYKNNEKITSKTNNNMFFSTNNYWNLSKKDAQYKEFAISNPTTVTATAKQADDKVKQKSNTMEEYVVNYYKKQIANTDVKGTIYSKEGNININGNGGEFNITGALITVNGSLNINGITHATLTYDPDYVPFFNDEGIFTRSLFESVF